jgi:hypothetical protein
MEHQAQQFPQYEEADDAGGGHDLAADAFAHDTIS